MKTRLFIVIALLLFSQSDVCSQINIDTSKIRVTSSLGTTIWFFYGDESGLAPLVNSKNQLEIRMSVLIAPVGGFEDRVIEFDGATWKSQLIVRPFYYYDTAQKARTYILSPRKRYSFILKKLERKGLFSLPSQGELNKPSRILDGDLYSVAYKIGDKFGLLTFDNPMGYRKMYRRTKEFRKYAQIVRIFNRYFSKD